MIITKTPFRISFFGGGTDYPQWYNKYGGEVLSTTINKHCYISCRYLPKFFEHNYRIVYSVIESVKNVNDIIHPSVREVIKWSNIKDGLEIHHDGDLPARSGLGSSSAFTVGLINVLEAARGKIISKEKLASNAINIEQNIIKENVGSQDQIAAAYGGLNHITFDQNGTFDVNKIVIPENRMKELNSNLILLYTGVSRIASEVAEDKIKNLESRFKELTLIRSFVKEGIQILQNENINIEEFGKLLKLSWENKRKLSKKISTDLIDHIFQTCFSNGAIGGKVLGAGGGGFILLFVPPERQTHLLGKLQTFINVPFLFENSGSKIVVYEPKGF